MPTTQAMQLYMISVWLPSALLLIVTAIVMPKVFDPLLDLLGRFFGKEDETDHD